MNKFKIPDYPNYFKLSKTDPDRALKEQDRTLAKRQEFLDALSSSMMGGVKGVCDRIGICRKTYYNWLKEDPEFAEAVKITNKSRDDFVMDVLLYNIARGKGSAIRFFLSKYHPDYMGKKKLRE